MNSEIVKKIKNTDFMIDWEGSFSLLGTTLSSNGYFDKSKEIFGKRIDFVFIKFENGLATAFLPVKSFEEWGTYLSKKALNTDFLDKWCDGFKISADKLLEEIEVSPEQFLKRICKLTELYDVYTSYQVSTKAAFNFLHDKSYKKITDRLEEARKYSEDFYKINEKILLKVIKEINSQVNGYSEKYLMFLTVSELEDFVKSGKLTSVDELEKRYSKSAIYWDGNAPVFLKLEEIEDIETSWVPKEEVEEIKGVTAFKGKIKGKCKIIKDYHNAELEDGGILVTGMTDPNFVPLMKKAGAIVTDGGGLLSHAAIVARELKKPCIIGTRIATKVLKDGDYVEVDADKGIVKILKNET